MDRIPTVSTDGSCITMLYCAFPSGRGVRVKIDISCLEQEPLDFDERFTVVPERLDSDVVAAPVSVRLQGEVRAEGEAVTVLGRIRADGTVACSRCLDDVEWTVDESFAVEYRWPASTPTEDEVGLDEDDLDVSFLEGNELDLLELAAEQILLALPMRILCDEDCAGLCPTCGANRNRPVACECPPEVDPRWQALAGLKNSSTES